LSLLLFDELSIDFELINQVRNICHQVKRLDIRVVFVIVTLSKYQFVEIAQYVIRAQRDGVLPAGDVWVWLRVGEGRADPGAARPP
jgi:hypothetical protein